MSICFNKRKYINTCKNISDVALMKGINFPFDIRYRFKEAAYKHAAAMLLCTIPLLRSSRKILHLRCYKHYAPPGLRRRVVGGSLFAINISSRWDLGGRVCGGIVLLQACRSDAAMHHAAPTELWKDFASTMLQALRPAGA